MADKKKTTRRPRRKDKGSSHDATVDEQEDLTFDDIGGKKPKKRKPRSRTGQGDATKRIDFDEKRDSAEAEKNPEEKKKKKAQIEKVIDEFVTMMSSAGPKGLREMYLELKNYIPTNYKFDTFNTNPNCNRYADVVCLDESRVKLQVEAPGQGDYIHANWVKCDRHDRVYIATQGPLENTVADFWRMCWEHEVFCIVMLCQTVEDGKAKCFQYWPEKKDDYKTFGRIFVNNKKVEQEDKFNMSTIEILPEGCSNSKIVKLIQFSSWPDRGVPLSCKTVLRLIKLITKQDALASGNVVVHCSAGIGRTGTIILIDWILTKLFQGLSADLPTMFKDLRNQRASSVNTEGQFLFIVATSIQYIMARVPNRYKEQGERFLKEYQALNLAQS